MMVPEEADSRPAGDDLPQHHRGSGEGATLQVSLFRRTKLCFSSYRLAVFTTQFFSSQDPCVGATVERTPSI